MTKAKLEMDPKSLAAGRFSVTQKSTSLGQEALSRLSRNRAAVMGGSIIILLILMAIFAPLIAIKPFDVQVLLDQNKVPAWLVSIFPSMEPYAKFSGAYPLGA